ncbi:hypothetical protein HK105_200396 [Polyrhizophydium stewartii]|uniref:Uncharacterized protein n=1 Tax=Polyrhizophydium stewartii TaxID=2732419 RepID=A0ABR4NLB9_9FUNG
MAQVMARGGSFIDVAMLHRPSLALVALIISCLSAGLCGFAAGYFLRRAISVKFTRALVALVLVNLCGVVLQAAEATYVYTDASLSGVKVWRNWFYGVSSLHQNLIQLEILFVFAGGLMKTRLFAVGNKWAVRTAAIALHVACVGGNYLEALLFSNASLHRRQNS